MCSTVISFVQYINLNSTRGYLLTELNRKKKLDEQIDKDIKLLCIVVPMLYAK